VAALLALLLIALVMALRTRAEVRRLSAQLKDFRSEQQRLGTSLLSLHGAMKVISEDVITHGQHQSKVTRTLERLADRQSELRLRDAEQGVYGQAIELARLGKSRDEVRKLCGLSESEVDLLFSLHAHGGQSARPD
jgi:predicted trehalose synthase